MWPTLLSICMCSLYYYSGMCHWEYFCREVANKLFKYLNIGSCQVLKSERNARVSSSINGDFEEKIAPSSGCAGAQISSRKKSSGPSARKRVKSCQSESASSNAKNISESSDSENGSRQDTTSTHYSSPSKTKLAGKCGISKRNSKRVAERVLVSMQKKQKKMVASDDCDSFVSGGLGRGDMKPKSNSGKDNEDTSSSSHKNVKSPTGGRSRRKESSIQDSQKFPQGEVPNGSSNEMITDPPATSSDDNLRKEEFVDENVYKQEQSDNKSWKAFEKGIFEKGVEIFGRNRSVETIVFDRIYKFSILCGIRYCY